MKQQEGHRFLDEFLENWKKEEWYEALHFLAAERFRSYRIGWLLRTLFVVAVTVTAAVTAVALGRKNGGVGALTVFQDLVLIALAVFTQYRLGQTAYRKYRRVLTQECDARQAVLAFQMLAKWKSGLPGSTFAIDYMTATALYAGGFEQTAVDFIKLSYGALSARKQQSPSVYLYYKNILVKCYRHMGRLQASAQEKEEIAAYMDAHPKCKTSLWYKQYQEMENIYSGIALRAFHDTRKDAEAFLAGAGSLYNRVTGHYLMYCIEKGMGNVQAAEEHADFVRQYGGGLALAKQCR